MIKNFKFLGTSVIMTLWYTIVQKLKFIIWLFYFVVNKFLKGQIINYLPTEYHGNSFNSLWRLKMLRLNFLKTNLISPN